MAPSTYRYIEYDVNQRIWKAHKEDLPNEERNAVKKNTIARLCDGKRTTSEWKWKRAEREHKGILLDVSKIREYATRTPQSFGANWHPLVHIKAYSWEYAVGLSGLLSGFVVGLSFYADRHINLASGVQDAAVGFVAMAVHVLAFCIMAFMFGYGSSSMAQLPQIICDRDIFNDTKAPTGDQYFVITVSNCDIYPHVRPITASWAWVGIDNGDSDVKMSTIERETPALPNNDESASATAVEGAGVTAPKRPLVWL